MNSKKLILSACAFGAVICLSCCVPAPEAPPPAPEKAAIPSPPPAPAPAPPTAAAVTDWRSVPVAAGDWVYRRTASNTSARFGQVGQAPLLVFRCDTATKRLRVARASRWPASRINGQMTVHTSYGDTQWPVSASNEPGAPGAYAVATRAANDGTLDQISFSRGRFVIEAPGALPLAVPSWAEVSRVIEDCRG